MFISLPNHTHTHMHAHARTHTHTHTQSIRVKLVQNVSAVERRFSPWIGGSILASLVGLSLPPSLPPSLLPLSECYLDMETSLSPSSPPPPRVPSNRCGYQNKNLKKMERELLTRNAPNHRTLFGIINPFISPRISNNE